MAYYSKYDYLNDEEELKKIIEEHKELGSLIEIKEVDQANIKLNFSKAENELKHAEAVFKISYRNLAGYKAPPFRALNFCSVTIMS